MTMQIRDTYRYEDKTYYLLARKGRKLEFHPFKYHLRPTAQCTACWSGYFCEYEIVEKAMHLDKLYIHHEDDMYPELNGSFINRHTDDEHLEHYHYDELHIPIHTRGTCHMLLGADLVKCSPEEINDFWNYETLKQLTFKNGLIVKVKDYSSLSAFARKRYQDNILALSDIKYKKPRKFIKEILQKSYIGKLWWIKRT